MSNTNTNRNTVFYRLDSFSRGSLRQMDVAEGPLYQQFLLEWSVFTSTASVGARSVR